jgi:hypothetical protein
MAQRQEARTLFLDPCRTARLENRFLRLVLALLSSAVLSLALHANAALPSDYQGKPFQDSAYKAGAQSVPGIVQCALFDLGGEGVAYHDADSKDPNTVSFDINQKPAAVCKLPVPTKDWHTWNYAQIGTIHFKESGLQLLTFHYNTGNNFAFFVFELVESEKAP